MRLAIELNDVIRDFSDNFMKIYVENYNKEYDLTDFEMYTNEMPIIFPFKSEFAYNNFVYEDFVFDLFGKCPTCRRNLPSELSKWMNVTLNNLDVDENIDIVLFSPMECSNSIGYTYFFISKLNVPVREVLLPMASETIFDRCDAVITANPKLLNIAKETGKPVVKITKDYNKDIEIDNTFSTLINFIEDENNILKLIEDVHNYKEE